MMLFRVLGAVLLGAALWCFALYALRGDMRWRQRGLLIVKWTVLAGIGFFAVLVVERVIEML